MKKSHLGVESTYISGGAKHLINFIPGHNNVLMRRPGSKHIKDFTVEDSENIKLFTIELNNSIYLLEFVLGKLRIYKDNVLLMKEGNSEIKTPYVHAEHLKCLNITMGYTSYETLFFCKFHPPYILVIDILRDAFSLKQIFFTDGPYENINTTSISLTPQNLSGANINIKASEPFFIFQI